MKLLDAEAIKEQEDKGVEEKRRLIEKLRAEESTAINRINILLDKEQEQKERLAIEIKRVDAKCEKIRREKHVIINILEREIKTLEAKKAEAMKPIDEIRTEAEQMLKSLKDEKAITENQRVENERALEVIEDRMDELTDQSAKQTEKEVDLKKRESITESAEKILKESSEILNRSWAEYHAAVHSFNQMVEQKDAEYRALKTANEAFKQSLNAEKERLAQEDLGIKDKYAALQRAKEHLGIK